MTDIDNSRPVPLDPVGGRRFIAEFWDQRRDPTMRGYLRLCIDELQYSRGRGPKAAFEGGLRPPPRWLRFLIFCRRLRCRLFGHARPILVLDEYACSYCGRHANGAGESLPPDVWDYDRHWWVER